MAGAGGFYEFVHSSLLVNKGNSFKFVHKRHRDLTKHVVGHNSRIQYANDDKISNYEVMTLQKV